MRWWFRVRMASAGAWAFLVGWGGTFITPSARFEFPTLAGGQFAAVPVAVLFATVAAAGWVAITTTRARELSVGTSRRWAWGGDVVVLFVALGVSSVSAALAFGGAREALVPLLFQSALAVLVARPGLRPAWLMAPGVALLTAMLLGFDSLGVPSVWALPVMDEASVAQLLSSVCLLIAATGVYVGSVARNPAASAAV
ncbi:hypothetical protein J7E45_13920 [Microbacterium sp. ISL-59]|uniref:hypothetical protein n=1 Tax=Microbacterium sp. ISL-59 TaxID=2819159 RepID=UPI001BEC51B8|nr:hypothetical protein [Microbacterium sp. ISL-59]MBT2496705.1 hypothetical protein [Microbacterium sp. ISL-59]